MPDSAARSAFPEILSMYMARNGVSQSDISKALNVSKQTVSDWANGKKFPRVDKMQELANMFGVLMSEMYTPSAKHSNDSSIVLSPDEHTLIDGYRALPQEGKEYMIKQITAAKALYGEKSDISSSEIKVI